MLGITYESDVYNWHIECILDCWCLPGIMLGRFKFWPKDGASGKVKASPKSVSFILGELWKSEQDSMEIKTYTTNTVKTSRWVIHQTQTKINVQMEDQTA